MNLLEKLKKNKGTVSSALGKSLAQEVLQGDRDLLAEAIGLICTDDKNVRSGAGKIIECVAEKKPELVFKSLDRLLPALEVPEPQTRWMILHVFGLCATLDPVFSKKALPKSRQFLQENSGMCLWDRSITYLGYLGAVSEKYATDVFPDLESALESLPERTTRIRMRQKPECKKQSGKGAEKIANRLSEYAMQYPHNQRPNPCRHQRQRRLVPEQSGLLRGRARGYGARSGHRGVQHRGV
jgi:hypothetical protein